MSSRFQFAVRVAVRAAVVAAVLGASVSTAGERPGAVSDSRLQDVASTRWTPQPVWDDVGPVPLLAVSHSPRSFVALLVVAVLSLFVMAEGASRYRSGVIFRADGELTERRRRANIDEIKRTDPAFDEADVLRRFKLAFLKVQEAWENQDFEPVRMFLSDGVFERFALRLQEQRDGGYRRRMDMLTVRGIDVEEIVSDPFFEMLTVRIRGSAIDAREPLRGGGARREASRGIRGKPKREPFAEFWTFLRRRGAKTAVGKAGLIEGNCPNCGADVRMNRSERCGACESLLRSGTHDWVLAVTAQASQWRATLPDAIPGVHSYRNRHDPGFNVPHLQDRASVIFWRKAMADRLGEVGPLRKVASNRFCRDYRSTLDSDQDRRRTYRGDCAVGAVEVRGVVSGKDTDRAIVEIRYSSVRYAVEAFGTARQKDRASVSRDLFVLSRKHGVTTQLEQSISSTHCPNCGAPEDDLRDDACHFCGTVLGDGSRDWVLVEIAAASSDRGARLMNMVTFDALADDEMAADASLVSGVTTESLLESSAGSLAAPLPESTALLAWMIKMAAADGAIGTRERRLLYRVARRRRIPIDRLDAMVTAAELGRIDVPEPNGPDQAREWLTAMIDTALIDGLLARPEAALLKRSARRLDLNAFDVKILIRKRKGELYRQARRIIRQKRVEAGAAG